MYQVFNPIQGQYEQANSLESAKTLYAQTVNNFLTFKNLFQSVQTDEYYKANQEYANEFAAIRYGEPSTSYLYSVYNATTKEVISQVFGCNGDMIKVSNGQVSEWYKLNYLLNDISHYFVSLDPTTEEPLDYYDRDINSAAFVVNKYDLSGQFIVSTSFTPVPEDKISLLNGFDYSGTITAWSDKSYGFCVEYLGPLNILFNDCNAEQQAELLEQRQSYAHNNSNIFAVNKETQNPDGSVTWETLDASDWVIT
jgi:hypothetical protein